MQIVVTLNLTINILLGYMLSKGIISYLRNNSEISFPFKQQKLSVEAAINLHVLRVFPILMLSSSKSIDSFPGYVSDRGL